MIKTFKDTRINFQFFNTSIHILNIENFYSYILKTIHNGLKGGLMNMGKHKGSLYTLTDKVGSKDCITQSYKKLQTVR